MPVLNEEEYIEPAVASVLGQEYEGAQELILALGPSTDSTSAIAHSLAKNDSRIRLVDNPKKDIPIALNLAIAASNHPVIIRVDAHSSLSPNYTRDAIDSLIQQQADNVGGIMQARGKTPVQEAISRAYNSPFGLGGGRYHGSGAPGPAESAYLGVFRREALELVSGYNENIRRGEDWELNLRLRKAGGTVWFDPRLQVTYWPRSSFSALAKQFFATGAWRAKLVKLYPKDHPWRFFAPGLLVLGLGASVVLAVVQLLTASLSWPVWTLFIHLAPLTYLAGVSFAAVRMQRSAHGGFTSVMLNAWSLITMHTSWGVGFLAGLIRGAHRTVDRSRLTN